MTDRTGWDVLQWLGLMESMMDEKQGRHGNLEQDETGSGLFEPEHSGR